MTGQLLLDVKERKKNRQEDGKRVCRRVLTHSLVKSIPSVENKGERQKRKFTC